MRRSPVVVLLLAVLAALPAQVRAAEAPTPSTYPHSKAGWSKFIADRLPALVEGESFTHAERRYEVTRLHVVRDEQVTRWEPSHVRNAVERGWFAAIVHLRIDGRLTRARIEGTGHYVTDPATWEWDRVLLYLDDNQTHDFVSGETR
jgi:hypothetical protein